MQLVDDKAVFVFVSGANAHHSEWLESVSPTDRHGRDFLDFCNLFGCEQLVRCPTHNASNGLNIVVTEVPDIVDVVVGSPLGTSYHCFVSCVLRVEHFSAAFVKVSHSSLSLKLTSIGLDGSVL